MSVPQPAPLELLDIVVPMPPSPWPPSLATAISAASCFILLLLLGWMLWRYWHARRLQRQALQQLTHLAQTSPSLLAVSELLKRVAISGYGRSQVASLSGEAWFEFLTQSSNQKADFNAVSEHWIKGIYQAAPTPQTATEQDIALAKRWLQQALPVKPSHHVGLKTKEQSRV